MQMYFFDLNLGQHRLHDYEGIELANDESARKFAIVDVHAFLDLGRGAGICMRECAVEVANARGEILFKVPFTSA